MKQKLLVITAFVCSLFISTVHAQTDITIGTGTATNTGTTYPCPLQDFYEGSRSQYLYTASELTAAGMSPGNITAIKFNVTSLGTFTGTVEQFAIRIGSTSTTSLSSTAWETVPATNLYGPVDYTPVVGINTFILSAPFFWNGTSNIVIETCNGDPNNATGIFWTSNPLISWTTGLSFNGSHSYRADDGGNLCGTTATLESGTQTSRPNIVFTFTSASTCSGTPNAGTAVSSSTNITCAGTAFTLSITGATLAAGLSYQWQSSTDNINWSNITGATTPSYTTTQSIPTRYYRAIVTCSGSSSNSTSVQVTSAGGPVYAVLPYAESFENTWINSCGTRDVPNTSWKNTPETGNQSWRRDDDGTSAAWSSNTGAYTPAASTGLHSARFHSYDAPSASSGTFDLYVNCNNAAFTKRLLFDFINTSGTDTLSILVSTDGGTSFLRLDSAGVAAAWRTKTIYFNSTSANTIIRFKATSDYGVTDIGLDNISLNDFPNCTGTPVAGTTLSSNTNISCYGAAFTLSLTGTTVAGGITYQWQTSTDNTTWTNISSATAATYVASQIETSRYYRAVVSCAASGSSSNSTSVQVTSITTPLYITLPLVEQFENPWQSVCSTRDVPTTSWLNSPSTGNSSWRRDDDGIAAAWTNATLGAYTPTGSNNTPHSARFHSYSSGATTPGTLDIYINASAGVATKRLVFDYINTNGTDSLDVLISTNGGTSFTRFSTYKVASTWTNQTVDFTSSTATTIVRFKATGGGTTDIGIDEINIFNLTNCTGTPVAGTIVSSAASPVCIGNTVSLSVTGQTYGQAGITYQWQSSPNNTTWTDITGATGLVYNFTVPSGFASTYYRLVVKCSLSSQTANSNAVQVVITTPTYATLPFIERFEATWLSLCGTRDLPSSSWRNTPATGNNSWRRDDDGTSAAWGSTFGNYTPTGSNGSAHSARFHSYGAAAGAQGNLDLFLNCNTGGATKRLKFDYINTSGNDSLVVLLSNDNGLNFTRLDSVRTSTIWKTKTIVFDASSATTVLRFQATNGAAFGTDIGLDSIVVVSFPNCSGAPVGGTAVASQTTACISSVITLSLTGHTVDQGGLSYKWQSSTNNTTWTDIPGANTEVYVYTVPSGFTNTYFRAVTSCSFSAASANSASVLLTVPAPTYLSFPIVQSFDSVWVTSCATRDVPAATGWKNIPFTGNNSWRRDNDTTGGGWTEMLGTPASSGAAGTAHYARIHTYNTALNGNLDLYVNCSSGAASKEVSFYYINPAGTDSLRVMLSTDGGTTFSPIGFRYATATAWSKKIIAFTSSSATTVIRFAAYGTNDFSTDIGMDEVTVKAVDCAQPPNITSTVTSPSATQSIAVIKWKPVFNALAYEVVVSTSPDEPNYGDITGDTTYTINTLIPVTQYYVYVRTLCFNGNISSWYTYSITTPCPSQPLPYLESFESITTANTLPSCMAATGLGTNVLTYTAAQTTFNRTPHTGNKFASFRWGTPIGGSWIFTQPFTLTAGTGYNASFWYRTDALTGWQILGLYYGTSQDPASMIKIDTLANLTNAAYMQMIRTLFVPTNGIYYLGIKVVATSVPDYLTIDDIELKVSGTFPVTLLKFTGEARTNYNHLDWITSTELNNKSFTLERSKDGINFSPVGTIPTKAVNGTSNAQLIYSFDDTKPLQGNNYYRLKQIDKDDKFVYSNIVTIKGSRIYELELSSIYPNPASAELNVIVASPKKDKVELVITDMVGKQVYQSVHVIDNGENNLKLNIAGLSSGTYIVKLVCKDGCNAGLGKFIKQ